MQNECAAGGDSIPQLNQADSFEVDSEIAPIAQLIGEITWYIKVVWMYMQFWYKF
jgi:hypothetical protein